MPFYSGRLLRDLRTSGDPVRRPRHLVVLEKHRDRLPAELASLYDHEHTLTLVQGRELAVYRLHTER